MLWEKTSSGSLLYAGLFFLLVMTACQTGSSHTAHRQEGLPYCLPDSFKQKISWVEPQRDRMTQSLMLTGSVEPNPDRVVHFISLVGGVVSATYFSLGDQVRRGQVLAELRSAELSELQAQIRSMDAQLRVANTRLQAVQSMYEDGVASQKDLIEARSELEVLRAEKEKLQAKLAFFHALPERGVFQIKSPITGVVTAKDIAAGMPITAEGEPLFTVSDLSEVWVMVNIYTSQIAHVSQGMRVLIRSMAYPGESFEGRIEAIGRALDPDTRVLRARVVLSNPDMKLKPGMLVDVIAMKETQTEAWSLPTEVLIFDNNQYYVVVYHDDCHLEIRRLTPIGRQGANSFFAEDFSGGEKIVSQNQLLIYEHLKNFR